MLLHLNGRERTEDDWKKLFAAADTRLEVEFEYWESSAHCLIKSTLDEIISHKCQSDGKH
jgi:hypothetical protein